VYLEDIGRSIKIQVQSGLKVRSALIESHHFNLKPSLRILPSIVNLNQLNLKLPINSITFNIAKMGSSGTSGDLILLTGGTGHIGYRTLIEALRAGYKVRASIRRESSIAEIKSTKSIQPYLSELSFVIVEDITKDGAFDEAVKDVSYIVHIASPLPSPTEDPDKDIIQPAIRGTLGILNSALKQPSVKRVVITASNVAVTPLAAHMGQDPGLITPESRVPSDSLPKEYPHVFLAYGVSKILAYNHTIEFIEKQKPKFTVINIMPSFVVGKNELAKTPAAVNAGSNAIALNVLFGVQNPNGLVGTTVYVDDVAKIHIEALDPKIEGNRNFGANCNGLDGVEWDSAIEIVKKHFPEAVESGIFPLGGSQRSVPLSFDARETEKVFEFKFNSFEEQIVSVAGWYVEVSSKA
jgi:nucleoside-diphosphate-sugar epimerase